MAVLCSIVARSDSFIAQKLFPAVLVWMGVFFATPCIAQTQDTLQYHFRHFTDENGLPQNSVKSIVPGGSGFIWLATENGLVRFDGHHFNTFNKENTGMESSRICFILPSGKPYTYYAVTDPRQVAQIQHSRAALIDHIPIKNNIYLKGHLYYGSEKVDAYTSTGLPDLFKKDYTCDTFLLPVDTATWFAIDSARMVLNHQGRQYELPRLRKASNWDFFMTGSRLYYWSSKRGPLWLDLDLQQPDSKQAAFKKCTVTGDLLRNKTWRNRKKPERIYWNIASGQVFFYVDRLLYLVTAMPDGSMNTRCILRNFNPVVNRVMSAYYDTATQQIFLGSITNGLFVFQRKQFVTVQVNKEGQEVYYAQLPYRGDKILTPWGRILSPFSKTGNLSLVRQKGNEEGHSMTVDNAGNIWIKSSERLYRYNADASELINDWSYSDAISTLYADSAGCIWIGFKTRGLYAVLPGKSDPELLDPLIKDVTFMQRTGNTLWLGTGKGLYRFSVTDRKVDTIQQFKGRYIRSLYVPKTDEIWITTYDDGFFLYTGGKLTRFPFDKNGYLATSHCIVEDSKGYFWITTNKGLFQASKQDLLDYASGRLRDVFYLYYTRENGFNTNEFNGGCQPCAVKLTNGYVSLPSLSGLVWFNPDSLRIELPDKDLLIDKMEVDQQLVPVADTIQLARNFQQVKLYLATAYYGNENNIRIQYAWKERNKEPEWLRVAENKSIMLSSLTAGRHHLVIRKSDGFGIDNYTYKDLILDVAPAYYETWWFPLGLLLVMVLIIWGFSAFRVQYVRHKNKLLEQRIAMHTGELEQTLAALQLSEEQLRRQTRIHERLITAMAHDIKSPLKYMTDAAWNMVKRSAGEPVPEDIRTQAQLLFESGTRIYYFTDNLLQYIKLYARQGIITMEPVNLFNIVEEKVRIFSDIAAMQATVIHNLVASDVQVHSNGRLLGVIIHNIIDNAVKVTSNGTITITALQQQEELHLIINDTGPGMREEMVAWCNAEPTAGTQQNGQRDLPDYMGMGLVIVKELLVLVNGRLHVETRAGEGTGVHIIVRAAQA